MTLSSSGLAAGFWNTPVLTFHPGPIMKQFLIVSQLFVKEAKEAYSPGTDLPPNWQHPGTIPEENRRHLKRLSLLPPLLCQDEWM